jgi:hypothetical protein
VDFAGRGSRECPACVRPEEIAMYIERTDNMKELFPEPPVLAGGRLCLKPLSLPDAGSLRALTQEEPVYRYLPTFLFEKKYSRPEDVLLRLYDEGLDDSLILGIFMEKRFCGLFEVYGFRAPIHKASVEEAAELYAGIAAKTGFSIPKDAILAFLKEKEVSQQAQSAKAEGAVKEALDEASLEAVAGGTEYEKKNPGCDTTYDKGEWCWFSDSCSLVISYYSDASDTHETPGASNTPRNSLDFIYEPENADNDQSFEDSFY